MLPRFDGRRHPERDVEQLSNHLLDITDNVEGQGPGNVLSAATMSPSSPQAAPCALGASQKMTGAPPWTKVFFIFPSAKNPIHSPLGESSSAVLVLDPAKHQPPEPVESSSSFHAFAVTCECFKIGVGRAQELLPPITLDGPVKNRLHRLLSIFG
jgi:hypothetical protein